MQPQIAVAFITSGASLLVAIVSIIMNNRILGYKVDELKKQVEKHNNLIERTAVVERDLKTAFSRIDDIRDEIRSIYSYTPLWGGHVSQLAVSFRTTWRCVSG